ncbi:MAG: [acyl-carrier-protein] S-malonyltransferase [Dehalococcoidia bacterium]|nr:[acyl-carrier-protein] S-malonyltransferase [Dehalococcoidia bacterium]
MIDAPSRLKTAYVFPGQGSQAVGMGADLYEESPAARQTFEEADDILGFSLSKLCFWGPEEDLTQTVNAQPAILAASVASLRALTEAHGGLSGGAPAFVAGHSLGEYTALVSVGTLGFADALRLVRERGRLMQYAGQVREGGMAAILGLDDSLVEQVCQQTGAEIANINSSGQIVISGAKDALVRAIDLARAMGARKAIPLGVSGAFHSSLMEPAVPGMVEALEKARMVKAAVPVVSNTGAVPLSHAWEIRTELAEQLVRCVQWSKSVDFMVKSGVGAFVEIGPGRVLTSLAKRIAPDAKAIAVNDLASVRAFAL